MKLMQSPVSKPQISQQLSGRISVTIKNPSFQQPVQVVKATSSIAKAVQKHKQVMTKNNSMNQSVLNSERLEEINKYASNKLSNPFTPSAVDQSMNNSQLNDSYASSKQAHLTNSQIRRLEQMRSSITSPQPKATVNVNSKTRQIITNRTRNELSKTYSQPNSTINSGRVSHIHIKELSHKKQPDDQKTKHISVSLFEGEEATEVHKDLAQMQLKVQ